MPLITCKNLDCGYEGKAVVENINFNLEAGSYLCILGENGSGKSTFMKTLLGLVSPIKGTIEYGDGLKSVNIGYLPQQTPVQRDFPASVFEIVLSGCLNSIGHSPFFKKQFKEKAVEAMEKMHITDLKDRCYRELSGGQQQRVLLARALCAADRLIVLDEPVTGLDIGTTAELYELIKTINEEGITIIMISHDKDAIQYCSHVLHMGKDVFFGTRDEYLSEHM